ncbi:TetR/AcrR family transcriptional regulator [Actinotalea solisilvae]|uniref:TetR/AcrR family transcriptional regulator n=1 Tax=Actinotalea solisilvae TaxID=2072922 RepID=UPI0027DB75D9|nr:TetR/AcrR family transcriptional regulator [Actinotalea solisilvae]
MTAGLHPRVARSRARALTAALELLVERGIAGTTIEAVADRSGVAKTTIYRQWPGQAALVQDAFDSLLQPPDAPDTGSVRGDLLLLVGGLADALSSSPAARLMPALIDAAERDADFAELHRRQAARRHAPVLRVLERAVRRGELAKDADLGLLLDLLSGPLFYRRMVSGGPLDRAYAERVVDHVLGRARNP